MVFKAFWEKKEIKDELVVFSEENGQICAGLAFDKPQNILLVDRKGRSLQEGKDFTVCGNQLTLINKNLPYFKEGCLQNDQDTLGDIPTENIRYGIHGCALISAGYMHDMQYLASYSSDGCDFPNIFPARLDMPNTYNKLANKKPFKIALFGDSISHAANSSFDMGIVGYKHWLSEALDSIEKMYDTTIDMLNISRSGYGSEWALGAVDDKLKGQNVDVLIIAFGMNDATEGMSCEKFTENISKIMERAKKHNENMEFILVSPPIPNSDCKEVYKEQKNYIYSLRTLETRFVAVLDMTSPFAFLLKRKKFCEILGNNLNHPNDFGYRFYTDAFKELFYRLMQKSENS